jgi:hypothetical protein
MVLTTMRVANATARWVAMHGWSTYLPQVRFCTQLAMQTEEESHRGSGQ